MSNAIFPTPLYSGRHHIVKRAISHASPADFCGILAFAVSHPKRALRAFLEDAADDSWYPDIVIT